MSPVCALQLAQAARFAGQLFVLVKFRDVIAVILRPLRMKIVSHSKCVRMHAVLDEAAPDGKLYVVLEYLPGGPSMEWDPSERCFRTRAGGPITEQMAQRYTIDTLPPR